MQKTLKALSISFLFASLIFVVAVVASTANAAQKRIIFVGNSLTGFNNLPGLFQQLAKIEGEDPYVEAHIEFGKSLSDHVRNASLRQALQKNEWDYIVLQEYSTTPVLKTSEFRQSLLNLKALVKSKTAKLVLFQNWPLKTDDTNRILKLNEIYKEAATAIDATVVPIGRAVDIFRQTSSIPLFTDEKHPTPIVTYLAALLFLKEFYLLNAEKIPHIGANHNTASSFHGEATLPNLINLELDHAVEDINEIQRVASMSQMPGACGDR